MPLAVGNEWLGRSYRTDSLGASTDVVYDTLRIVSSMQIDGETWYASDRGALYANRADGLWVRSSAGGRPVQQAKHPASVGDRFGRDTVLAVVRSRLVVAVGTQLSVTAGTYLVDGYQLVEETLDGRDVTPTMPDVDYYAPGVGPVQSISAMPDTAAPMTRVWELVEARLK
jgi:hypothetical protein